MTTTRTMDEPGIETAAEPIMRAIFQDRYGSADTLSVGVVGQMAGKAVIVVEGS